MGLHALAVAIIGSPRLQEPQTEVRLVPRADGLYIYGQNVLNMPVLKFFGTWSQAESYLHTRGLQLPQITYAENGQAQHVETRASALSGSHFIVSWLGFDSQGVVLVPDQGTAEVFARHVRYQHLTPSPLGFGLSLDETAPITR